MAYFFKEETKTCSEFIYKSTEIGFWHQVSNELGPVVRFRSYDPVSLVIAVKMDLLRSLLVPADLSNNVEEI